MFHRLHGSPSSQGYKQLGPDASIQSVLCPELSGHGGHGDGVSQLSRTNTIVAAKSYGDLKGLHGRSRAKKTRAIKWLVLRSSGERQIFTLDKRQVIQTCQLEIPIRDMRLMDSALGTETLAQLLVRDNALVFSMEHVRLIIMSDKVVVPLDDGGPLPPPQGGQQQDRTPAAAAEVKDRFISHLEGVVMDWALQHGSSLMSAATASQGGMAPSHTGAGASIFSGQAAAAQATTGTSTPQQQQVVSAAAVAAGQAGTASGGALPSIASQLEAHLASHASRTSSLRMGPAVGAGAVGAGGVGPAGTGGGAQPSNGNGGGGGGPGSETASQNAFDPEYQPFEMLVLETALSEICTHLSREVDTLHVTSQPAVEALMKTADTANLEAVRRVKTQHARLVTRVTATREALERLMEDDDDMVRMCLTQQAHMRVAAMAAATAAAVQQLNHQHSHQHSHHQSASALVGSAAAGAYSPDSPSSPPQLDAHQLAMMMGGSLTASYIRPASLAARAVRHQVAKKSGILGEALAEAAAVAAAAAAGPGGGGGGGPNSEVVEHDFLDVENLLESYAIIVDTTYQTLMSIGEFIDDTEDLINIQLDYSRNKLIRFDILLTTGTFALAFFNIVTGMLGENMVLPDTITQDLRGFILVNGGTLVFCFTTFVSLVMLFKWQKVL